MLAPVINSVIKMFMRSVNCDGCTSFVRPRPHAATPSKGPSISCLTRCTVPVPTPHSRAIFSKSLSRSREHRDRPCCRVTLWRGFNTKKTVVLHNRIPPTTRIQLSIHSARAVAVQMIDHHTKLIMLNIAQEYEKLAARAEQRAGDNA